jgi:hypothetical protein
MGLRAMNQYMHLFMALLLMELTKMLGLEKYFLSEYHYKLAQEQIPVRLVGLFIASAIAFYQVWKLP